MECANKRNINLFVRKPFKGNFSVEDYKNIIVNSLSTNFDIKIIEMPFYSKGVFLKLFNIIYCYFKQNNDINHVLGDIHYVNLLFKKKYSLLTVLDVVALHHSKGLKKLIFKYFWLYLPIRNAKEVLVISKSTLIEIKEIYKENINYNVTYLGAKHHFSRFDKKFNKSCPTILQIGTKKNKNLDNLIEAISEIKCKLVIVGNIEKETIKKLNFNKIEYVSKKNLSDDELLNCYKECDIVSFASFYEGFGIPIIEANIVGRVVVTSNIFSMAEVGKNSAYLVDPYDIKSIREGFVSVIKNEAIRKKLIENGFKNAQKYTIENNMRKLKQIYKNF